MDECEYSKFVLQSSAAFGRNVSGIPFAGKFSADDADDINHNVMQVCDGMWGEDSYESFNINTADKDDVMYWEDINFCPVCEDKTDYARYAVTSPDGNVVIATNDTEHVYVQAIREELDIDGAYKAACDTVNALSHRIPFAVKDEIGFLTAKPLFAGAALKISALVHMPALTYSPDFNKLTENMKEKGIRVKSFFNDGKRSYGSVYRISNIYTMGITEDEIVDTVLEAVKSAAEWEYEKQSHLISVNKGFVQDTAWRALGVLACSRQLSMAEFMTCLSSVRMGASLGVLDISMAKINELFLHGLVGYVRRYEVINSLVGEGEHYARARIMREETASLLKRLL